MIRLILEWFFPYDPEPMVAPNGRVKKKKKGKGKGKTNKEKLHINKNGQSFVKREEETEHGIVLSWDDGSRKKVSWIEVDSITNKEIDAIEEEGLILEKYNEVRPMFFLGHSPRDIEKHYKGRKIRGYSKSTLYPYHSLWEHFYRPKRPKS